MKKHIRGFTLIELLVVMAIIAVLAAVGMASYRSANERGRNARRAADLEQVRAALEMYRTDNSAYPEGDFTAIMTNILKPTGYIGAIPTPPTPVGNGYTYCTGGSRARYILCASFEGVNPASCDSTGLDSVCQGNYGVKNP